MFHSCARAFCLPPLGFLWIHVARTSALLCGGTGPAGGGCRDRRFKYEPDVAPYMFLPKMTEEMGDALVDLVSWTEECSGPPCLCVPDDRFASKSWLSQGMPGVQEGKLCVARSRLPGPDPGGCEDDRRERYPMKLGDYMFEEGYFGTKGWGFGVMCHASLSGFVRVEPGAGRQDGRRQEIDNRGARGLVGEESDVAVMMQSYSHRSTGPRPDGIPRRDFEELVADFRQLVDMGIGRRARRDLIFRVQCRQPARVLRFLQEVLGGCLDDDAALPIDWPSGKGSGKGPGALPHSDEDEPDVTGLFQGDVTPRRTWEQLMDLFWEWFEGGRQVGMAVGASPSTCSRATARQLC